jgi:pyridoxal phosphate enzyme (YggS family)
VSEIAENLSVVRERVAEAARRSGRDPAEVDLLVVSKTWPAETVAEVVASGQVLFGENKVQEAEAKAPLLPDHLVWHLVGPLQRNKVRKALSVFQVVHGVGSLKLAQAIDRVAGETGRRPQVYLQVNIGGEGSKSGFLSEELEAGLDALLELKEIAILGLMAIPPREPDAEATRRWFVRLRELRDRLVTSSGTPLPGLSMGMSGDYETAIEEGSTIVRVGSAIFGDRVAH